MFRACFTHQWNRAHVSLFRTSPEFHKFSERRWTRDAAVTCRCMFRLRSTGVVSVHFHRLSCLNQFVLFILLDCSTCSFGGRRPVAYDRVCTMRFSSSWSRFNARQLLEATGGATLLPVPSDKGPLPSTEKLPVPSDKGPLPS